MRHFTWHTIRHTFASHLVMQGIPIRAVQELLGHSTITMTERYAHLAPSSLASAVAMLSAHFRGQPAGNTGPEALEFRARHLLSAPRIAANLSEISPVPA